ncbi:MAG TPA: alanine--tRNA ligase [Candidatus Acidoferrales bacterium]|nr:alanine--tRNA ligase [Candidatus Acidoferrales bacterium]
MTGNEIRRTFLDFFARHGHRVVRSSSLVPTNDPTLLFTNAGMNQFKDVFLGLEQRDYKRAASVQKCVRAGGKHNDLENVGRTVRHHTFFEMLGNFSFGDYFKREAIAFAWELVTKEWRIPPDRLYATIFKGEEGIPRDTEAYEHWLSQGLPRNRIYEFGSRENFWAMGDTGPCGPSSEIHYDMGPRASEQGHTDCALGCACGRYLEIWNLVFMQFNRDASGGMKPLPKPSIDTGAGLERLAAVLQRKVSNFDTDLLRPLVEFASELSGKPYGDSKETDISLRILADHSRAAAFLVGDGVLPSNEGRGYVLRKIIRRAVRHGRMLGLQRPFLFEMASQVAELMREPYPELLASIARVDAVIKNEEQRYEHTLKLALKKLDDDLENAAKGVPGMRLRRREDGTAEVSEGGPLLLSGQAAFRLYDTYGLSLDLLEDEGSWRGFRVDRAGFDRELEKQRERARASWKGVHKQAASPIYAKLAETFQTEPDFYYSAVARDCRIEAMITKEGLVNEVAPGTEAEVVLDRTPFYAEAGGQVADVGFLYDNAQTLQLAEVRGAYYPVAGLIAHRVLTKETLRTGDRVSAVADSARREHIKRNHTATHLMHAALRNILGTHVKQSGSLVAPDRLRFDFTHFAAPDADELHEIELEVNDEILRNVEVVTDVTTLDDALASGALAFFGDKYPEQNVRVVTIPDSAAAGGFYSKELCGGTHVRRTGDIGVFKIIAEQSVAAGIRRLEAITGVRALGDYQRALGTLRQLASTLRVGEDDLPAAVERLTLASKQIEKQLQALKHKTAHNRLDDLLERAKTVKGVRVISAQVEDIEREAMRQLVDALRQKLGSGVVVLGTTENGKVAIIGGVTKDLTNRLHAGRIVQAVAREVGGAGGGRPDLAEAGGKDTSALERAMETVYGVVHQML